MGQKVNPHGLRVGIIKDWDSRWFVKDEVFGDTLVSDYKLRKFLTARLAGAGVAKIEIERDNTKVRVIVRCAKPGIVIGKGGTEIEKLRKEVENFVGKPAAVNVIEIKQPDLNALLVAQNIAAQLEKRTSFRRAMKMAIGRTMKLGAKGIKVAVSGRLAVQKSQEPSITMKAIFRFRPSEPISITASMRLIPPTVRSASRYGYTRVRFFPRLSVREVNNHVNA